MKQIFSLILLAVLTLSCTTQQEQNTDEGDVLKFITTRLDHTLETSQDSTKIPRTIDENGELVTVDQYSWTSGFFPGNMWYMYELTGEDRWKTEAIKRTEALDTIQYWTGNHDVGFMIYCSYGNGLKFGEQDPYEEVIVQTAESLSARFDETTKALKSWNKFNAWDGSVWDYPVIIDNMMNLELMFEASLLSGNQKYKDIAIQHAETTMQNHYREDYSSYHVVNYDTISGEVLSKKTAQGFADESSWARGQAWGLYGFTLCYRYTKDEKYLAFAENIASYIINHPNLPEDGIPFWDYQANSTDLQPEWEYNEADFSTIPRDASAAAITASALYELSEYSDQKAEFLKAAEHILTSLQSNAYMDDKSENKFFILDHSVGSIPHGVEIDVPLVYADYYFLEALYRQREMTSKDQS